MAVRNLPTAPEWAKPVETPTPKAGDDPLTVAARERGAKAQANRIIIQFSAWYDGVRSDYAKPTP